MFYLNLHTFSIEDQLWNKCSTLYQQRSVGLFCSNNNSK